MVCAREAAKFLQPSDRGIYIVAGGNRVVKRVIFGLITPTPVSRNWRMKGQMIGSLVEKNYVKEMK